MTTLGNFWFTLPFLFAFLFQANILKFFGLEMSNLRARSSLVRNLVNKMAVEKEIEDLDKSTWYSVNLKLIKTPAISSKFHQFHDDSETEAFIISSFEQSDWILTQLWYNFAKSVLSWFYCQTDINGMLNRGSMFVFSKEQFLKMTKFDTNTKLSAMLDLGAGDGRPTQSMSSFFTETYTTEVSGPMRKSLTQRGFKVLEIDNWVKPDGYDLISALNLFDRCDKPLGIIADIHTSLKPGGLFLVALVLPFKPYVESVPSHKPSEKMDINGETFEAQVEAAVKMFEGVGFTLEGWARVPYLCEGDLSRPLYHLNNALMLFKKKELS
eukprot:GFUD01040598.1.p1 GENE.GFUD01040598.1~~GFUD01040598.1.p1  ORF type:complete len:325 (-),score=62.15 GFUD01040598.1:156-1130(-)